MILGIVLIVLGLPFAACNWYSPFSEMISGKFSSMVPPVGGVLIFVGLFWITNSIWWSLLAILLDFGLLFLFISLPTGAWFLFQRSSFNLVKELRGEDKNRHVNIKLFKNEVMQLSCQIGTATYGLSGSWKEVEGNIEFKGYLQGRKCFLTLHDGRYHATETKSADHKESDVSLEGLIFYPKTTK